MDRQLFFYDNDISIINSNKLFTFLKYFNLKRLNISKELVTVFSLQDYIELIKEKSNLYEYIVFIQESNNNHVIFLNDEKKLQEVKFLKDNLYFTTQVEIIANIDLIGPARKFFLRNQFLKNNNDPNLKMYIDKSKDIIISKLLNVEDDVHKTLSQGKIFLMRFVNNMSYLLGAGMNIRKFSCSEKNKTGISYYVGETEQAIKPIDVNQIYKLNEITKKNEKLYNAFEGLNKSLTSITTEQSLIVLWSTIETLFNEPSVSLFDITEMGLIVSFIGREINKDKAKIVKEQLPNLKSKTRNEVIIGNILKLDEFYKYEVISQIIRRAAANRGKCSHTLKTNKEKNEVTRNIKELKKIINEFTIKTLEI